MDEWWKALITLAIGFVLGFIACLLFRRRGVSDGTGTGADSVGQLIDEVGDAVTGAGERADESVRLAGDVADTGESVAESVERLSDGNAESQNAIREARESVGRIKDLIEAERKRNEQPENQE